MLDSTESLKVLLVLLRMAWYWFWVRADIVNDITQTWESLKEWESLVWLIWFDLFLKETAHLVSSQTRKSQAGTIHNWFRLMAKTEKKGRNNQPSPPFASIDDVFVFGCLVDYGGVPARPVAFVALLHLEFSGAVKCETPKGDFLQREDLPKPSNTTRSPSPTPNQSSWFLTHLAHSSQTSQCKIKHRHESAQRKRSPGHHTVIDCERHGSNLKILLQLASSNRSNALHYHANLLYPFLIWFR